MADVMRSREEVRRMLEEIRDELHDLGVQDRMRMLARGEFADLTEALEDEPEPAAVTEADVDEVIARRGKT